MINGVCASRMRLVYRKGRKSWFTLEISAEDYQGISPCENEHYEENVDLISIYIFHLMSVIIMVHCNYNNFAQKKLLGTLQWRDFFWVPCNLTVRYKLSNQRSNYVKLIDVWTKCTCTTIFNCWVRFSKLMEVWLHTDRTD